MAKETGIRKVKSKLEKLTKLKSTFREIQIQFTKEDAMLIAKALRIEFDKEKFSLQDFWNGINVELEHGSKFNDTNVTKNDPILTGKIALAHLKEFPDYYERLEKLEKEAKEYWADKEK